MSGARTPQHAGMVLGEVEPSDPADLEAMEPALACCYFVLSIGDQGSQAVRKGSSSRSARRSARWDRP
jgi:hypothetical protein